MPNGECQISHLVKAGDVVVTGPDGPHLWTPLGTCVAAFISDSVLGIAGMNHFVRPTTPHDMEPDPRYGDIAMQQLVDALYAEGARGRGLQARLYGGADALGSHFRCGLENAEFAIAWCSRMGIPIVETYLGGRRHCVVRADPPFHTPKLTWLKPFSLSFGRKDRGSVGSIPTPRSEKTGRQALKVIG